MAFPFQTVPADIAKPMSRTGMRMRRAVAVQKRNQMRAVQIAVPRSGVNFLFDRDKCCMSGLLERRVWPFM